MQQTLSLLALSWLSLGFGKQLLQNTVFFSHSLLILHPIFLLVGHISGIFFDLVERISGIFFFGELRFKLKGLNGRHCVKGPLEGATTTAASSDVITQDALQENNSGVRGGKLLKFIKTKQS